MSPTLSAAQFSSTSSSWFPGSVQKHHLGRKDVVANIRALEYLAKTARKYEEALRGVSEASMLFAEALEQVSKAKDLHVDGDEVDEEEDDLVEGFRSLSGYQYYTGSQQRVLAQLVHEQCTSPLGAQSEAYRHTLTSLHKTYSTGLAEKTASLKKREKQHLSQASAKHHDLDIYRRGLEDLTAQLDALDQLKYEHYETVAEHTRQVWSSVLKRTTVAARAQVDIMEKISDKGLQNDCLGRMIASSADPFTIVPVQIIDQIRRVEVVQQPLTPIVDLPPKPVSSDAVNDGGGPEVDQPQTASAPTAPSPPITTTDPFEMIDDVPSVHSESVDDLGAQVSQMEVPRMQIDGHEIAMTPPMTPPKNHIHDGIQEMEDGHRQLLTKLGGYGWRG